eukprot:g8625.t1
MPKARYHSCPPPEVEDLQMKVYMSTLESRSRRFRKGMDLMEEKDLKNLWFEPLVLSYGSFGHPELCHRPCVHLAKGQCKDGADCGYCHLEHGRPVHPDRKQRQHFKSLSYPALLATLMPFIRNRWNALNQDLACSRLMDFLERELLLRPAEAVRLPDRALTQLLSRMSLAGLVGLLSVRSPPGVMGLMRGCMEDVRMEVRVAEGL